MRGCEEAPAIVASTANFALSSGGGMNTSIKAGNIKLKRAVVEYPPESTDGARILVDRLWPRGVKKEDAAIDEWMKDIAPSTELRK